MVRLITDSTCDLPPDLIERYGIVVVPLKVLFGDETYQDGVDITPQTFFDRLRRAETLPTTSQPSAGEFHQVFQPVLDAGDEVLGIFISSKLSGTLASAETAQEAFPGQPITLLDSLSTTVGLGFQVLEAARALEAGAPRQEAAARVLAVRDRIHILFTVDTLEYLRRGGRIGGAQALLGTMLSIRPILAIQDGMVQPFEKVRTRKRALGRIADAIVARLGTTDATGVGVLHGAAEEEAHQLSEQVRQRVRSEHFIFAEVTPIIGVHTGPGVIGVAAYAGP